MIKVIRLGWGPNETPPFPVFPKFENPCPYGILASSPSKYAARDYYSLLLHGEIEFRVAQ